MNYYYVDFSRLSEEKLGSLIFIPLTLSFNFSESHFKFASSVCFSLKLVAVIGVGS